MKLPAIGRDKGQDEQEKIDAAIMSEYEDQESVMKPSGEGGGDGKPEDAGGGAGLSSHEFKKLSMDVEKMKAQMEALLQMRSVTEERFSRTSEEIGDLRRRFLDEEKNIGQLRVDSSKAIELVSSVQPQKLMMEVKKEDTRVEAISARQEADRKIIDSVVEELKNIKNTLSTFTGTEMLIELNEEVKKELNAIKKSETVVEKHANKVESIFGNVQSRFNEFVRMSDKVNVLDASFRKVSNEFDSMKVKMDGLAEKKEFAELKTEVQDKTKNIESKIEDLNRIGKELKEDSENARKTSSRMYYEFETRTDNRLSDIEAYTRELSDRVGLIVMYEQNMLRARQRQYRALEELYRDASARSGAEDKTRDVFNKVAAWLNKQQLELGKNISLVDNLVK